ncbi:hypothetical protein NL676_007510 [Syzygium grande]|nr:hypothetical protein NL676_007510 [Syzygium grande]
MALSTASPRQTTGKGLLALASARAKTLACGRGNLCHHRVWITWPSQPSIVVVRIAVATTRQGQGHLLESRQGQVGLCLVGARVGRLATAKVRVIDPR